MDNVRLVVSLDFMVTPAQEDVKPVIPHVKLVSGHLNIIVFLAKHHFIM
jgi:hypothetical protein